MTIDFSGLAQAIWNTFLNGFAGIVQPMPNDFEHWLLGVLQHLLSVDNGLNLLTHVPLDWTTRDSDVVSMFHSAWPATIAIAVLVCAVQAMRIMHGSADVYEAIGRTAFFVIVGNGVLLWADHILAAVNALADFVSTSPVDLTSQELPSGLEFGALLIVATFFALLATLKGAVGAVFIKVLIVSAPYLIVASALPKLSGLATWWAEEFTTWTLRPFMVALVIRLGLGLMAREGGPLGLLFAIVAMWLAWTMDTRIRRLSMGTWGSLGQANLFARGARIATGAFGGGAIGATAAAAAPAVAPSAAAISALGG